MFAHSKPAKNNRFADQTGCIVCDFNVDPALDTTAIEQDCFLCQPIELALWFNVEGQRHARLSRIGSVNTFCSLRGHTKLGVLPYRYIRFQVIAARQSAGRVDQDGIRDVRVRFGKHQLEAPGLVQVIQP